MVAPLVAAAGISAAATLGAAGIGALTSSPAPSTAWQIPLQTQHDFDMFNLNQNYNWAMYNAQTADARANSETDYYRQLNLLGMQNAYAQMQANEQRQWEMNMAQYGVGMRVADAIRSGVSPLVALGAPTFNPSPAVVGTNASYGGTAMGSPGGPLSGPSSLGASGGGGVDNSWLAKVGANIGDIAMKALTPEDQRAIAIGEIQASQKIAYNDELLRSVRLDNAIKIKNLGYAANPNSGSNPLDGQNSALGKMTIEPAKVSALMPGGNDNVIAGVYGEVQLNRTHTGLSPVPSKQSQIQDQQLDNPLFAQWMSRNQIATGWTPPIDPGKLFPGATGWEWNQSRWEFSPTYNKGHWERGKWIPDMPPPRAYYGSEGG